MRITIKDIAKVSGVSYSTVSKALNNSPLVKEDTKRKILEVAKKLGYQPNISARNLVSKKSRIIGVVWPTIERIALSSLVTRINQIIEENSYSMILSISDFHTSVEMLARFQVDGIILFEEEEKSNIDPMLLSSVPILSYSVPNNNPYPVVDVNHKKAISMSVNYLKSLGHEDISFIGHLSINDPRQKEKYLGFLEGMKNAHIRVNKNFIIDTNGLNLYNGYLAAKTLLKKSILPTAIIASSYDISAGVLRAVKEANLEIPNDISIIAYDNIPQMANLETPLNSIGVPIDKLASKIVYSLLQLIEEPNAPVPLIQSMTPELVDRGSCKRL
ncbi:LacI family DNA-binding transcriptional regulator [Tuberibacillus calidus]|jgi:LacI family transcriptional regulator|uniref:LacI family DNA-binding transcriptional regulator n=1 Tax=Tuberibacillus calidus TaxID=340097 RepID=UPI000405A23D|nr:LacI family DNA-binding transcriptional regulator [Tuberibacillus calidus]